MAAPYPTQYPATGWRRYSLAPDMNGVLQPYTLEEDGMFMFTHPGPTWVYYKDGKPATPGSFWVDRADGYANIPTGMQQQLDLRDRLLDKHFGAPIPY